LEKAIDDLQLTKARVRESFARMNQTHELFELSLKETSRIVSSLEAEQRYLGDVYAGLLDFSARQIQRCFRGHLGRRLFRQTVVVRAVLRVQRKYREFHRYREETRKKSRVLYRRVLRGLRGVRERHELSHAELLTRVGHNLQVEAQWRKAMGVKDTESDLITALYRKKYVRRRMGAIFRHLYLLHSITTYWKSLLPEPGAGDLLAQQEGDPVSAVLPDDFSEFGGEEAATLSWRRTSAQGKIVIVAPRDSKSVPTIKRITRGLNRDELRRRQKATLQEIQQRKDDELRKEAEAVQRLVQARRSRSGQTSSRSLGQKKS
jgi:hypothetical protein